MKAMVLLGLLAGLLACNSNPYGDGNGTKPIRPEREKPVEVREYSLDVPNMVTCQEDVECTFNIVAMINGAQAEVELTGMPTGAAFSPQDGRVVWRPSHEESVDTSDPRAVSRLYVVSVMLRDRGVPVKEKTLVLIARSKDSQ